MKRLILFTSIALLLLFSSSATSQFGSPFGPVPPDDTPYNATTWNGSFRAPTQNAVRDQIETLTGTAAADLTAHTDAAAFTGVSEFATVTELTNGVSAFYIGPNTEYSWVDSATGNTPFSVGTGGTTVVGRADIDGGVSVTLGVGDSLTIFDSTGTTVFSIGESGGISRTPTVISSDQEIAPGIYFVDTAGASLHLSTPVAGDCWDVYGTGSGLSIFSNDAISFSIGGASYGNASGASLVNNTDVGPSAKLIAASAVSIFVYPQGTWGAILP